MWIKNSNSAASMVLWEASGHTPTLSIREHGSMEGSWTLIPCRAPSMNSMEGSWTLLPCPAASIGSMSVLARQPSRAADSSPPLLAGGGEGDPLCVLASRRWGPTYIASYTHTLGSWDDFLWSLTAVNVEGTSVTTWADERGLRRCLLQLSDTCFGTTASSSPYGETWP